VVVVVRFRSEANTKLHLKRLDQDRDYSCSCMLCSRISSLDYLQVPGTVNRESSNPEIYGWIFNKMQDSFILFGLSNLSPNSQKF